MRRSWRRVIPLVWASASDTVSAVVGTATASVSPRTESTLRREIVSDVMLSLNTTSLDFSHGSSCDIHNAACIVREQPNEGSPKHPLAYRWQVIGDNHGAHPRRALGKIDRHAFRTEKIAS